MRIASLSPAVTEILFLLGVGDHIVCTDQFSNFPDEAKALPHLKDHVKVSVDALKEYAVDLVFTSTVIQERLAVELRAQNFSVIHQDPRTILQIQESIKQIGMIMEREIEAKALTLSLQQALNDTKRKAALLPRKCGVYIEEWHQPPMASGNWVPELVRYSGVESFPLAPGSLSREVTLSEVQKFDPDIIVISWCGAGSLADPSLLKSRAGWDTLRAVQQGNVRVIDDSLLNRPGPRLVEGAQRLYGWAFEFLH